MKRLLFLVLFILMSCSTAKKERSSLSGESIFPNGVYQHDVKLDFKMEGAKGKSFSFKGVASIGDKEIKIIALSPFGTTLSKIQEDRATGKVTCDIYYPQMKAFEDKLLHYYSIFKEALSVKKIDGKLPERVEYSAKEKALFLFRKYDKNNIPEEIKVQGQKFEALIKVVGYDL
jgi:hypothetical protein